MGQDARRRATESTIDVAIWRHGRLTRDRRVVAEETPVALSYNGIAHAVMMATPADLEDFAIGFSLTEGIVGAPVEIESLSLCEMDGGLDLQMTVAGDAADRLSQRRRSMAGPVGCGLCGIDSIEQAMRPLPRVPRGRTVPAADIDRAIAALVPHQAMNHRTRAVHGAAHIPLGEPLDGVGIIVREDVGRHNALDKLVGAMARAGRAAPDGLVVVTSRLSVEMVQKAAMMAAPILIAVSAPTALAIRAAEEIGLTIICVARSDGFEVATHPWRVGFPPSTANGAASDVA
ncbi:formate dehydrogenase accessory sulfurtransferase FdhD [Fodinicurvata sp. EGI_FJ10296]|uniref:formate dehydrogenase accessory sulfurtransferase FdhD n=1 Tax=Fodinicurvata sp. EGI_FJ10296 TaxID=3231908 RepID=UPI003451568D